MSEAGHREQFGDSLQESDHNRLEVRDVGHALSSSSALVVSNMVVRASRAGHQLILLLADGTLASNFDSSCRSSTLSVDGAQRRTSPVGSDRAENAGPQQDADPRPSGKDGPVGSPVASGERS